MTRTIRMPGEEARCWRCQVPFNDGDALVFAITLTGTVVALHEACGDGR